VDQGRQNLLPEGIVSREDLILASLLDPALHELAHGIFDLLQIPVLGGEEQAADQFASFALSQLENQVARRMLIGATYFFGAEHRLPTTIDELSDEHGTMVQRFFNKLCLAFGSDTSAFKDLRDKKILPLARAAGCLREYEQIKSAYSKLFDPALLAKWRSAQGQDADQITLTFDD